MHIDDMDYDCGVCTDHDRYTRAIEIGDVRQGNCSLGNPGLDRYYQKKVFVDTLHAEVRTPCPGGNHLVVPCGYPDDRCHAFLDCHDFPLHPSFVSGRIPGLISIRA